MPASAPLIPPNTLQQRLTPLLFEFSRLLSIVPSVFGALYNIYHAVHPPASGPTTRVDYLVSLLWVRAPFAPAPPPAHAPRSAS